MPYLIEPLFFSGATTFAVGIRGSILTLGNKSCLLSKIDIRLISTWQPSSVEKSVPMPNATVLSPELFNTICADVLTYIQKKLHGMEIDVSDLELHNSSVTKTLRVYVTVSRSHNLKALYLAEQMICKELQQQFALLPYGFYWRYFPEQKAAGGENSPSTSGS